MSITILYSTVFFILGSAIGSFLNVCAYRIPKRESIAHPGSHCTSCGSPIRAIDNIPILSYFLLRGRCRNCKSSISLKYPIIEALTGTLWMAAYLHFGLTLKLLGSLFFISILILLSSIDYETKLIPNRILLPSLVISALFIPLYLLDVDILLLVGNNNIAWPIYGFLLGGGFLYLTAILGSVLFKKETMGGGDIKLASFIGLYLGGYVLLALLIGFFFGAIVGLALIAAQKKDGKEMIPFGPFIAAGSIIVMFYGPQLWNAYLKLSGLTN